LCTALAPWHSIAVAVTLLTRGSLFGVSPTDPLTFAMIPIVLLAVAFLASALPACQATRLDPIASLRSEQGEVIMHALPRALI
jgi:ABC-type antimicrobial peptide transport system permease subunit